MSGGSYNEGYSLNIEHWHCIVTDKGGGTFSSVVQGSGLSRLKDFDQLFIISTFAIAAKVEPKG
jgi:hypothetical protein